MINCTEPLLHARCVIIHGITGSHTCGAERRLAQAEGHARIAADLPNRLGTTGALGRRTAMKRPTPESVSVTPAIRKPRIATAVGIFYMQQYITDIPDELIEAAHIDGCGDFKIFTSIVIPVIKPALASWASVTLIARWNDFFWPLLYLRKQAKYTLMVSISLLPVSEGLSTPWPVILAGTTLVIIPIIVLYLLLQTFQKAGLTAGAVKG